MAATALLAVAVMLPAGAMALTPLLSSSTQIDSVAARTTGDHFLYGQPIDVNSASATRLELVPGIGPALAARIIAGRPYDAVADLDHVKGIGPKTLAKISRYVQVR